MGRWTEQELGALPSKKGFRLRGLEMTRLEVFTDAAFAFATTMLVISLSGIPSSVNDLINALKDVPAFFVSFISIAWFWYAHREWSRRYGLEDGVTTLISLGLVFVMLVFVYPLKMVFSALFAWITDGWLPTSFVLEHASDLPRLFVMYGIAFSAMTGLVSLLYARALRATETLGLNAFERVKTVQDVVAFGVLAATGLMSCLWAGLLPPQWGVWAGFWYSTLPITMPIIARTYERKARRMIGTS